MHISVYRTQVESTIFSVKCSAIRSHKSKLQLNVNIFNNIRICATQLEIFQALLQMIDKFQHGLLLTNSKKIS